MSTWTYMNIKGQGHSLTLVQGHLYSTFSNFFSLEIARQIEAKFHLEPPWDKEMKDCSNGLSHMTKLAAMTYFTPMSYLTNYAFVWENCKTMNFSERKFVQLVLITWPKWPPCPNMVKNSKYFLLWNQKTDDFETWYSASGGQVLPS